MSAVRIIDMTSEGLGRSDAGKSNKTTSSWFLTSVYHRVVRRMGSDGQWQYVPDYEDFKNYLNEKVSAFYDEGGFRRCLTSEKCPEMQRWKVKIGVDVALEINSLGYLHHHAKVRVEYPREVDEKDVKRRLKRYFLDYTLLNRIFREVVDLGGMAIKIDARSVSDNSANLENYIRKKDG